MNRFKHFALTMLIALTSLTASAYSFEVDGIYYNILSKEDLTCEVTFKDDNYNSYSGDISIPSAITYSEKTFSVTSIGKKSFFNCTSLTLVEIPNSVTSIGTSAFSGCTSLTSMVYPNSVTSIEEFAFYGCKSLTTIEISNSVTLIGGFAFFGCSSLTSVMIPNSVSSIGNGAFSDCPNIESFSGKFATEDHCCLIVNGVLISFIPLEISTYVIPNSVTSIGDYAFYGCSGLTSLEIPNSVTSIGGYAFYGCSGLTSLVIGNSITSIGEGSFRYCSGLTSLEIPNSVTSIGVKAFYRCSGLISLEIPNSVTSIGDYAFYDCYSLTSLIIPNSVTSFEYYSFDKCYKINYATFGCAPALACYIPQKSLKEITLQENLTHFLAYPFNECSKLTKLTSLATEPLTLTKAQFTDSQFETLEVIVPDEALEKYMVADVWKEFKNLRGVNIKDVEVNTCGNPVLSIVKGQLKIELPTEGSKCKYSITTTDTKSGDVKSGTSISLSGEYKITAYAYADGYKNSETITATLVWVNPTLEGSTDVISMEAKKAVLIRSNGNSIVISGTEYGERVDLYDISGNLINTKVADDGETIIPCNTNKGEIILVKYGDKAVKCRI